MIPKIIHYVWLGGGSKSDLIEKCISSWKIYLPDCKIIEWNESNSPIEHPIVKFCLEHKKWAFASDYIRIWALYNHGGFYFDADIEVLQPFPDKLFQFQFVAGYEKISNYTNGAIIGAIPNQYALKQMLGYLENRVFIDSIGKMVHSVLSHEQALSDSNYYVAPHTVFYPLDLYGNSHLNSDSLTIHHWDNSWSREKYRFFADYFLFSTKKLNLQIPNSQLDTIYNVCINRIVNKEELKLINAFLKQQTTPFIIQNIRDFYLELLNNYLGEHYISPSRFTLKLLIYSVFDSYFWTNISIKHKCLFAIKAFFFYKPKI